MINICAVADTRLHAYQMPCGRKDTASFNAWQALSTKGMWKTYIGFPQFYGQICFTMSGQCILRLGCSTTLSYVVCPS